MPELILDDRGRAPNFVLEKDEAGNYRLRHQISGLTRTFGPEKPFVDELRREVRRLAGALNHRPRSKKGRRHVR